MKLTEAQKARRIKNRLSFQKRCGHHSIVEEPYGPLQVNTAVCENCGKTWEIKKPEELFK